MCPCRSTISATDAPSTSATRRRLWCGAGAALLVCSLAPLAWAQSVAMSGAMGSRAVLVIDGKTVTAAAGQTVQGVKVVSVASDRAVLEFAGKRQTVVLGAAQVNLAGTPAAGGGTQIVLTAGSGGHFMTPGQINGATVQFMVDTGATMIAMSAADAQRMGLKYQDGPRGTVHTANGSVPAWRVNLTSVRIGDVEVYNVDGLVSQADMPFVLLGNSFLSRFQMKRENDRMTLDRRF